MDIRGLNEFQPSSRVFSLANLTGKTMYNCEIIYKLKKRNKKHVLSSFARIKKQISDC